jgi:SAM-dependent methyltransferase
VIADVVESVDPRAVLDLGCGPGSLATRLADRLPEARITGVDGDRLLLELGRATAGDRVEFVEADLAADDWADAVPARLDAAVSTTALHWLSRAALAALYTRLGELIRPGGVFVNGDHLPAGPEPLRELARTVRVRRAERAGVTGNEEWGAWWDAVRADGALAELAARRRPQADDHGSNLVTVDEHAELLRAAGFRAVAPVWQSGDDHVLVALR